MAAPEEQMAALSVADGAPAAAAEGGKPKKEKKPKADKPKQQQGGEGKKKETKLGLTASKEGDFGDWYSQVVVESEMISYYDVSGCYILRPYSFAIWDEIKNWFDARIKELGVQNAYFPLFITEDVLMTEKEHVEGFAPEVAWVTKSGSSELDRPIAIRPTSETVMYPYYAQWIRSHRDLPLRLNQWTNVVRWEFKHPTPFIRSREFLWQEGHTVFATKEEADTEVYQILDLYRRVYEELLAVPVCKGMKSSKEKFAGALYTTSVEAFIPTSGRGVQGATSHCLGQNFSKMFGIEFETEEKTRQHAWQNSWGLTTRTIGVMVMTHGDDKGVVIPPRVAQIQVVVIPIPNSKLGEEAVKAMLDRADAIAADLKAAGVRVTVDRRDNYTPGWKYNFWELRGVPLRLELGPRDMDSGVAMLARRDNGGKQSCAWGELAAAVPKLLEQQQAEMYAKARAEFDSCIERVTTWDDFMAALERKHMALAPWCDTEESEEEVKRRPPCLAIPLATYLPLLFMCDTEESEEEVKRRSATKDAMGAKTLCIPLEQPDLPEGTPCFVTGAPAKCWALWGRSY
ncbi:proline--tRNA cytoplasmic isoform A [Chlorella sorokiniana]|uniref:proline--tRNA ligase n=1 Tax=Chlorella sorokiniana TaxID=3076 RepID=A0A2P6TU37_CHLSO|nr:proline--tRNA cytoplasmic isoform A [Chlorella sorokiniana]|eukprot:PRW57585.1 proline--tRNA cytoplasmic isoform A [Chlorella sorokiniana]